MDLRFDGLDRTYVLHVPDGTEAGAALVVSLHGGGGQAATDMASSGLVERADELGFVVAFPNGSRADPSRPASFALNPQSWNDGSGRGGIGAVDREVDDVGFLAAVLDDIAARVRNDPSKVYVTGFSNGASMSFRLARELPGRLAAIAPIAGDDWAADSPSSPAISLAYVTGDSDPLNPVEGGEIFIGGRSYGIKRPTAELIARWRDALDCPVDPQVSSDDGHVRADRWAPCRDDAAVELRILAGHGHHWPGSASQLPRSLAGPNATDFDATAYILGFFDAVAGL